MRTIDSKNCVRFGYNHNIPHRGRVFHVQTEDSGCKKGHIFTHVFCRGAIIATAKIDYSDEAPPIDVGRVCELMRQSHVEMIQRLCRGDLDAQIDRWLSRRSDAPTSAAER